MIMTRDRAQIDAIWIGVDIGTQSVRALALSEQGNVLGSGSHPLTSSRHGPKHEQDPQQWWEGTLHACQTALQGLPTEKIKGIAVDSTSGTLLLTDQSGQPLTAGIMYDDTRALVQAERINTAGARITPGYHMQPSWALPRLLWLMQQHQDQRTQLRVVHQADFINQHLIGAEMAAIPSDTSTVLKTGYDLLHDCWPHALFADLGIPENILPTVVLSGTQIGTVGSEAAKVTGIPAGTPVIAGMTDGCASQIGSGALSVGSWNSVLGTTLVLKGVTQERIDDPTGVIYSHRSPDGGWLPGGASSTGADVLSANYPPQELTKLNQQAELRGISNTLVYPLQKRGERFPFSAPAAEGFILGTANDAVDLYLARLQGVAFIERLCFDYLDLLGAPIHGEIRLTGGGARNHYWNQLRADTLNRPVSIPENTEAALGMAILAASNHRKVSTVAHEMVHLREVLEPNPKQTSSLLQGYVKFVNELEKRSWLSTHVAEHARKKAGR
jgi:sugar (pentulose or hexulose) kinase